MARLNTSKREKTTQRLAEETTTNKAGAVAYKLSNHAKLIEQVVGAFWNENAYYSKGSETAKEIIKGVKEVAKSDPRFPLQLAAYARNVLNLRTTPQVLLVESARIDACKPFVAEYTPKIVKRADELAEVVAYYTSKYGKGDNGVTHKNFPNALKRGLAKAFTNFDEYQLNKYDSSKSAVSLGQVAKLVHPSLGKGLYNYLVRGEVDAEALPKTAALKALLAKNTLDEEAVALIRKSSATWETVISKFGSSKETWELVIPNMGYMALLRNLRNFEEKGVDLEPVLQRIANPEQVKRSKQLPYRFFSAHREVSNQKVQRAIAKAFDASVSNVGLEGSTAVMVDLSGSMSAPLSAQSKIDRADVGSVLAAIVVKKSSESIAISFSNNGYEIQMNPDDTMMTNVKKYRESIKGEGGTNATAAFRKLGNRKVDRIVVISDMQCYGRGYGESDIGASWKEYSKMYPDAWLYSIDVAPYGTKQTPSKSGHVVTLNGWSDKIIDMISVYENEDAMLDEVRKW